MNVSREDGIVSAYASLFAEELSHSEDFNAMESFAVKKSHELMCRGLARALEEMDEAIFAEHDARFFSCGLEARELLTTAGNITFKRRRYRCESGSVYLLDAALDIPEKIKVSPLLSRLGATFAIDASYRAAADALAYYIGETLSGPSIARMLKQSAALIDEGVAENAFEKMETIVLDVEADGIRAPLQRTRAEKRRDAAAGMKRKRAAKNIHVFSAYAGKDGRTRHRRRESCCYYASSHEGGEAWEAFRQLINQKWDCDSIYYTNLATDGDPVYLAGEKILPGAVSVGYDLHHIPAKIRQVLGSDAASDIWATMSRIGFDEGIDLLNAYCDYFFRQSKDDKYLELERFFYKHASAMRNSFSYNLGCAESTNAHIIGKRMKHFGGGWRSGLEPMARLRAARASGITPALAHRKRSIALPEKCRTRHLSEIEAGIAALEQKARKNRPTTGRKESRLPEYYHCAHINHTASREHAHSLLHEWA